MKKIDLIKIGAGTAMGIGVTIPSFLLMRSFYNPQKFFMNGGENVIDEDLVDDFDDDEIMSDDE